MISDRQIRFEIAFPKIPDSIVEVWNTLVAFLKEEGCLPKAFEVSQIVGHLKEFHSTEKLRLSPEEIKSLITQRHLSGFQVYSGAYPRMASFNLTHGKELGEQSHFRFSADKQAKVPSDWMRLIEGLMIQGLSIGAWQWNCLYGAWQGALELHPSYIGFFGVAPPGMRKIIRKSIDGIGSDRVMLDISSNPGRSRELVPTIYFHPTAEMWLGPHFWQYAKCTKEEALAAGFWLQTRDTPHYTYFKCWPAAFTRPDGEQGRMQQNLWKLFFHEDCEWPPGSGTICDEPMYGPPELMPQPPTSQK